MANNHLELANTGDIFGKLTVLRRLICPERLTYMCECECGEKEVVASLTYLRSGKMKHCGCTNPLARREADFEVSNGLRFVCEAEPTERRQKDGKYIQKVRRIEVKCLICGVSKIVYLHNFRKGKSACTSC